MSCCEPSTDLPRLDPIVLALTLVAAFMVEDYRHRMGVDVGNQASPQMIFFDTEYAADDVAQFVVPIEVLGAFFFVAIALVFVGPGQVLGRGLRAVPNRIRAYTLNIAGSLAGIALFAFCSWLQLSPLWWFGFATLVISNWLFEQARLRTISQVAAIVVIVIVAWYTAGEYVPRWSQNAEHFGSPYYRIGYMHSYRLESEPYVIVGALAERRFGRIRLFVNAENLTDVRQTRWDSLLRPERGADGRWTVDAWAPLNGRVFNGGIRMEF